MNNSMMNRFGITSSAKLAFDQVARCERLRLQTAKSKERLEFFDIGVIDTDGLGPFFGPIVVVWNLNTITFG